MTQRKEPIPMLKTNQTEKQFQADVIELARLCGWLVYHTHDSRRSEPGFPDLVLVRPPRVVFVECKSELGKLTPDQSRWLHALQNAPDVFADWWRPSDWEKIERFLTRQPMSVIDSRKLRL